MAMIANEVFILPHTLFSLYTRFQVISPKFSLAVDTRISYSLFLSRTMFGLPVTQCSLVVCPIVSILELLASQPGLDGPRSGQKLGELAPRLGRPL